MPVEHTLAQMAWRVEEARIPAFGPEGPIIEDGVPKIVEVKRLIVWSPVTGDAWVMPFPLEVAEQVAAQLSGTNIVVARDMPRMH